MYTVSFGMARYPTRHITHMAKKKLQQLNVMDYEGYFIDRRGRRFSQEAIPDCDVDECTIDIPYGRYFGLYNVDFTCVEQKYRGESVICFAPRSFRVCHVITNGEFVAHVCGKQSGQDHCNVHYLRPWADFRGMPMPVYSGQLEDSLGDYFQEYEQWLNRVTLSFMRSVFPKAEELGSDK